MKKKNGEFIHGGPDNIYANHLHPKKDAIERVKRGKETSIDISLESIENKIAVAITKQRSLITAYELNDDDIVDINHLIELLESTTIENTDNALQLFLLIEEHLTNMSLKEKQQEELERAQLLEALG